jgi:hypothetical protein
MYICKWGGGSFQSWGHHDEKSQTAPDTEGPSWGGVGGVQRRRQDLLGPLVTIIVL